MDAHRIVVPRTAHYYTVGQPSQQTKYFWIACHGYGQAASKFIRKFESIAADDTFVVAPEGLSRFYWKDFTGEVVASWMTKGDRLDEIADYSNYLTAIRDKYLPLLPSNVRIVLLGFSQGVATQFRWIMNAFPEFDCLIAWAGMVPEDLDYLAHQEYWNGKKIYMLYGDEDEFLTPKRLSWHNDMLESQQLSVDQRVFHGKHRILRPELVALNEEIKRDFP